MLSLSPLSPLSENSVLWPLIVFPPVSSAHFVSSDRVSGICKQVKQLKVQKISCKVSIEGIVSHHAKNDPVGIKTME